jgi:hypothetical protein
MTVKDLIVTEVALFSWREGSRLIPGICPAAWRGIAHVLNNRLRAGWWEGDWLKVIAEAPKHSPNLTEEMDFRSLPDHWSREFRAHYEACEQIYENRLLDDVTTSANASPKYITGSGSVQAGVYYCVLNRVTSPWFQDKILSHTNDHPRTAEISGGDGNLVFLG